MMNLALKISKLKVLKQSHRNQRYDMDDAVAKWIPRGRLELENRISDYTQEPEMYLQYNGDEENKFAGITLKGKTFMAQNRCLQRAPDTRQ